MLGPRPYQPAAGARAASDAAGVVTPDDAGSVVNGLVLAEAFGGGYRMPMRFFKLLSRALRLRCPVCGQGWLFRGWFAMHPQCPHCGATFEREPGFFLGSIYINYGLTVLIVSIAYPILLFNGLVAKTPLLIGSLAFTLAFPVLLFPWARSLWLGFDQWRDPRPGESG